MENTEGVDDSEVYFRIEPFESIDVKKDILESVSGILRMQISSEKYREIKTEIEKKRRDAEKNIIELKRKINEITEKLPSQKALEKLKIEGRKAGKEKVEIKKEIKKAEVKKEIKKEYSLERELAEIQRRLEQLE